MPVNTYEGMFLLDSTKVAVSWDDVGQARPRHPDQAQVRDRRQPPVGRAPARLPGRRAQEGDLPADLLQDRRVELKEIVADCHLSDLILRELILKVHPKLVDHLVNQAMTSTPSRGRRRPRREEDRTTAPAAAAATTEPASREFTVVAGLAGRYRIRTGCRRRVLTLVHLRRNVVGSSREQPFTPPRRSRWTEATVWLWGGSGDGRSEQSLSDGSTDAATPSCATRPAARP